VVQSFGLGTRMLASNLAVDLLGISPRNMQAQEAASEVSVGETAADSHVMEKINMSQKCERFQAFLSAHFPDILANAFNCTCACTKMID
jgi:hypothetical protein